MSKEIDVDESGMPEFNKIKIDVKKMEFDVPYEFEIKIPTENGLSPVKFYALKTEEGFIRIGQSKDDFNTY